MILVNYCMQSPLVASIFVTFFLLTDYIVCCAELWRVSSCLDPRLPTFLELWKGGAAVGSSGCKTNQRAAMLSTARPDPGWLLQHTAARQETGPRLDVPLTKDRPNFWTTAPECVESRPHPNASSQHRRFDNQRPPAVYELVGRPCLLRISPT